MDDLVYFQQICYFLIFHNCIIILILDHHNLLFFSGNICLSLGISLSSLIFPVSFMTYSELFCGEDLEDSLILLAIESPVASAVFMNCFFWSNSKGIRGGLFNVIEKFLAVFTASVFTYVFTDIFANILSIRQESTNFYKYSVFRLN